MTNEKKGSQDEVLLPFFNGPVTVEAPLYATPPSAALLAGRNHPPGLRERFARWVPGGRGSRMVACFAPELFRNRRPSRTGGPRGRWRCPPAVRCWPAAGGLSIVSENPGQPNLKGTHPVTAILRESRRLIWRNRQLHYGRQEVTFGIDHP